MTNLEKITLTYLSLINFETNFEGKVSEETMQKIKGHKKTLSGFLENNKDISNISETDGITVTQTLLNIQKEYNNIIDDLKKNSPDILKEALKEHQNHQNVTQQILEIYRSENKFINDAHAFPGKELTKVVKKKNRGLLKKQPGLNKVGSAYSELENKIPLSVSDILTCKSINDLVSQALSKIDTNLVKSNYIDQIISAATLQNDIQSATQYLHKKVPNLPLIKDPDFQNNSIVIVQRLGRYQLLLGDLNNKINKVNSIPQETKNKSKALHSNLKDKIQLANDLEALKQYVPADKVNDAAIIKKAQIAKKIYGSQEAKEESVKEQYKFFLESAIKKLPSEKSQPTVAALQNIKSKLENANKTETLSSIIDSEIKENAGNKKIKHQLKKVKHKAKGFESFLNKPRGPFKIFENAEHFQIIQDLKLRFLAVQIMKLEKAIDGYTKKIAANKNRDKKLLLHKDKQEFLSEVHDKMLELFHNIDDNPNFLQRGSINFSRELKFMTNEALKNHPKAKQGISSRVAHFVEKSLPASAKTMDRVLNEAISNPKFTAKLKREHNLFTKFEIPKNLFEQQVPPDQGMAL